MCLLIVAEKDFPSKRVLELGEKQNSDGGGIAWIDGNKVFWKKNLSARNILKLARNTKAPWIIHFRKASIGLKVEDLCHPFPTEQEADLLKPGDLVSGSSDVGVLAHNGNWHGWHDVLITLVNEGHKLPKGPWSDTRAMAWASSIKGEEFLKGIKEKVAWLTPNGVTRYGSGWSENLEPGVHTTYNPFVGRYSHINNFSYDGYELYDRHPKNLKISATEFTSFDEYIQEKVLLNTKEKTKYEEFKIKKSKTLAVQH